MPWWELRRLFAPEEKAKADEEEESEEVSKALKRNLLTRSTLTEVERDPLHCSIPQCTLLKKA